MAGIYVNYIEPMRGSTYELIARFPIRLWKVLVTLPVTLVT